MVIVRNLTGRSHVFNLADGKTLRLMSHKEKSIPSSSVSDDIRRGVSMGIVAILTETPKSSRTVSKHSDSDSKESTKKSGGKNKQEV